MLEKLFVAKAAKMLHTMEVLDTTGHTKTTWDPDVPAEVANAKATFESLTANKKYRAFRVKRDGGEGEPMAKFDPEAAAMILVPAIVSG